MDLMEYSAMEYSAMEYSAMEYSAMEYSAMFCFMKQWYVFFIKSSMLWLLFLCAIY